MMEDDQQFCLRWNNHQSTLIQNFDTLLESGTLVDCTLAAEGKYLKAHKVVLSACSPYFEGLLSEHYDKHPVFILKDVKFKELKAMMDYMYRGEVNISQDQLAALLKAAESLQIKGLSESKTGGSKASDTRQTKVSQNTTQPSSDIPQSSSHLTIEKNKVPRISSVGDLPEDSASPQISKGLSSREGSVSPTSRKRKRIRRRSLVEDNSVENHETSNSSDIPQQMPVLGIAPVTDEKSHADAADSLGRSALMTQLTKPADEMLQLPLEKPEPNDSLIEPKSEYLEDQEESVEDLTLDDDMNDLSEMDQDTNRAGPSHDPSQHPGLSWHVTGDRSNAGGVVGSVAAPGATDEVFLAAQEAAHRDSQDGKGPWLTARSLNSMKKKSDLQTNFYHQTSVKKSIPISSNVVVSAKISNLVSRFARTSSEVSFIVKKSTKRNRSISDGCPTMPILTRESDAKLTIKTDEAPVVIKRGRGRPKKIRPKEETMSSKRGRGRPKKLIPKVEEGLATKRKRGRPRKIVKTENPEFPIAKKKRGRPRKIPLPIPDDEMESHRTFVPISLPFVPITNSYTNPHVILHSPTTVSSTPEPASYDLEYLEEKPIVDDPLENSHFPPFTFSNCDDREPTSDSNEEQPFNADDPRPAWGTGREYRCTNCEKVFAARKNLKRHCQFTCGVEPQFTCRFCSKPLRTSRSLDYHMFKLHPTEFRNMTPDE